MTYCKCAKCLEEHRFGRTNSNQLKVQPTMVECEWSVPIGQLTNTSQETTWQVDGSDFLNWTIFPFLSFLLTFASSGRQQDLI